MNWFWYFKIKITHTSLAAVYLFVREFKLCLQIGHIDKFSPTKLQSTEYFTQYIIYFLSFTQLDIDSLSPSIDLSKKITNNFGFNFSCSHSFFHRNLIVYLTYSRRWTHEIQQKLYISWVIHRISAIEFYLIQYGGSNFSALWSFSCWLNNHVLVQQKSGCFF